MEDKERNYTLAVKGDERYEEIMKYARKVANVLPEDPMLAAEVVIVFAKSFEMETGIEILGAKAVFKDGFQDGE